MDNKWDMLESSNEDREKIWTKNRTFAGDVWFRFRHKPTSIAGFVIILLLILFAAFGPLFTKYSYSVQDLEVVNIPPRMKVYETPDNTGYLYITQAMKVLQVNSDGTLGIQLKKVREESERMMTIFDCNGTEVALYYGQKPYVIANPENNTIYRSKNIWNKSYLLGTDNLGRDILTRLMYGTRVSLMVAFVAVAVNLVIGVLYGGISGYLGGNVDAVMMRIVDIISTIPLTLYVILIMVILGSGLQSIVIAPGNRLLGGYGESGPRPGARAEGAGICPGCENHRLFHQNHPAFPPDTQCHGFHSGNRNHADTIRHFMKPSWDIWVSAAAAPCQPWNHVQRRDREPSFLSPSAVHSGSCYLPDHVCF